MTNFKEIVTKAVIGKSKKISHNEYKLSTDEKPNTVLGCWIINHSFSGRNENGKVRVIGSFDINVWYSCNNDTETKVNTQSFNYEDIMPVTLKEGQSLDNNTQAFLALVRAGLWEIVRSLRQPTVTDVNIISDQIVMNVEKELGVEIVGDTKLKISVEEEEDDYELISDDTIEEVKDDFLDS